MVVVARANRLCALRMTAARAAGWGEVHWTKIWLHQDRKDRDRGGWWGGGETRRPSCQTGRRLHWPTLELPLSRFFICAAHRGLVCSSFYHFRELSNQLLTINHSFKVINQMSPSWASITGIWSIKGIQKLKYFHKYFIWKILKWHFCFFCSELRHSTNAILSK